MRDRVAVELSLRYIPPPYCVCVQHAHVDRQCRRAESEDGQGHGQYEIIMMMRAGGWKRERERERETHRSCTVRGDRGPIQRHAGSGMREDSPAMIGATAAQPGVLHTQHGTAPTQVHDAAPA